MKDIEYQILEHFVEHLEANGLTNRLYSVSISQAFVDKLNSRYGTCHSLEELLKANDKCLANEWIELQSKTLDRQRHSNLGITQKGIGVVRSKRLSIEQKASRSLLKKTSDYIEDHKGLFILFSFIVTLVALFLRFGDK